MALWEYKVITSGKGGFASATMLESFLNQLGKDEWEIIDFRTDQNNSLVFNGLARRPTQREWTLEAAVAAAAKAEADKLRAELMQKQHAGDASASADGPAGSAAGEKAAGPAGLRQLRDTELDSDPEALAEEASQGEGWENLDSFEDDLPTFFDAIKPHMRKNQNAAGQSVALNYLAKRWDQPETDLHGALAECGFVIPENDTDAPVYLEYEGDLYWVEKNNRGQFFLNTREKPRPKFRIAQGKPLDPADPAYVALAEEQAALEAERAKRAAEQAAREAEAAARRAERDAQRQAAEQARREQQAAAQAAREAARAAAAANAAANEGAESAPVAAEPADEPRASAEGAPATATPSAPAAAPAPGALPEGVALLDAIRPQMRRNRRGPGYSGSSAYLAKFFKVEESALRSGLAALGLVPPATRDEKAAQVLVGNHVYWVNKDNGGGLWINGRDANQRDRAPGANAPAGSDAPDAAARDASEAAMSDAPAAPAAEPGVFRAVPREMPPLPAPAASAAPLPEAVPAGAVESVAAPAETAPVAPAEGAVAPASEPEGAPSPEAAPAAETTPAAEEKVAEDPGSTEATPPAGEGEGAEGAAGAPVKKAARSGSRKPAAKAAAGAAAAKPRTKRRASSAIEADEAAEE